jgi:GNAT superfamily N-acetyltransferase
MAADVDAEDAVVLVAEAGGEPVGQLGLHLAPYGVADLGMLVAAGWRGRGVGTALLAEAVRRARRQGPTRSPSRSGPTTPPPSPCTSGSGSSARAYLGRHYRRRSGELWDAVVMGLPLD